MDEANAGKCCIHLPCAKQRSCLEFGFMWLLKPSFVIETPTCISFYKGLDSYLYAIALLANFRFLLLLLRASPRFKSRLGYSFASPLKLGSYNSFHSLKLLERSCSARLSLGDVAAISASSFPSLFEPPMPCIEACFVSLLRHRHSPTYPRLPHFWIICVRLSDHLVPILYKYWADCIGTRH
jgi:hypothetical protein